MESAMSHLDDLIDQLDCVLSVSQAAKALGKHPTSITRAIERKELLAYRLGSDGQWMILREDLRDALKAGTPSLREDDL